MAASLIGNIRKIQWKNMFHWSRQTFALNIMVYSNIERYNENKKYLSIHGRIQER
jgi:hypothetical protein